MTSKNAVLIPVCNPGDKLRRTLVSIKGMPHGNIVIVNDGGQEDISPLRDELGVDFELIDLKENVGITKALNVGVKHCLEKGYEFIARIDAGDIALSNRFEKQISYLTEHPGCMLVGSQVEIRNLDGGFEFYFANPTDPALLKLLMHTRNVFFHSSVMFRASVFKEIGLYDETFPVAQDYEFFFRIAKSYEVGIVNEILVYDLYNPNGISYARRAEQLRAKLRVQLMYFSPLVLRSYLGVMKSLIIISLPDSLTWRLKKFMKNAAATLHLKNTGPSR